MTNSEILYSSIAEIGALYRSRALSPVEVTELALAQIERFDSQLRAFITVTADLARGAAQRAERELHAGQDRGPLHGIPVGIKDLVDTAGIRTTAASHILKDNVPTKDAEVVKRLKQAGAVIVGKTNMQEFAYGAVQPEYGMSRNPWDFSRTAGGSSGGSAAALGAGMCYAAIGSDTGGSIRHPCAYCGVAGLKPTYARISVDGVIPLCWSLDHVGPMARTGADTAPLFEAMAGIAPNSVHNIPLKGLRIGVIVEQEQVEMDQELRAIFDNTLRIIADAGAKVERISVPPLAQMVDGCVFGIVAAEASAIHARWIKERPEDYAPMTRQQLEMGFAIPAVHYLRLQEYRRYLVSLFADVWKQADALICPNMPWVSPHEDLYFMTEDGAVDQRGYAIALEAGLLNLTGQPGLAILSGFNHEQLPVGLQVIAPPMQDEVALGVGMAIESLLPATRSVPLLTGTPAANSRK